MECLTRKVLVEKNIMIIAATKFNLDSYYNYLFEQLYFGPNNKEDSVKKQFWLEYYYPEQEIC